MSFEKNPLKQYLTGLNISNCQREDIKQKINRYWFFDFKIRNKSILNFLLKKVNDFLGTKTVRVLLRKDVHSTLNNNKIDIYFGSDYWAITNECAKYLLRVAKKEKS